MILHFLWHLDLVSFCMCWISCIDERPNSPFAGSCGCLSPCAKSIPTPINQLLQRLPDLLKLFEPSQWTCYELEAGHFSKAYLKFPYVCTNWQRHTASFCCTAPSRPPLLRNQPCSKAYRTCSINKWKKQLFYSSVFDKWGEKIMIKCLLSKAELTQTRLMRAASLDRVVSHASTNCVYSGLADL